MPLTKFQGLVLGVFMTVTMTYGMEVYNAAIRMGYSMTTGVGFSSMTNQVFVEAAKEAVFMCIIVFIVSELIGNKVGARFMKKYCTPKVDNAYMCQVLRQAGTIAFMCPAMSFVATIIFQIVLGGQPVSQMPAMWVGTVIKNFPMAFFLNMFFAAPLSRLALKLIFRHRDMSPKIVRR